MLVKLLLILLILLILWGVELKVLFSVIEQDELFVEGFSTFNID